ncbi:MULTISPECIES: dihydrofolate reductase [unclassified Marinobacterium]|uniref:dihydrofolate reductase n=1 Tax=unclassified Marinobacterium TaxID=2644139 RepID=UPI001569E6D4|nr:MULTISPECIES: dihydrofolate reductase [unclassified Marinobacterium]NRP46865.1 Dihydrofolate reductase type 3 [Marinobacterium sp. xm-d-543]NRQ23422.1 Dihydrofolate reductase type 3 [Marinobacterium sp. xm-m-312]
MRLALIVAQGLNRVIGNDNKLPWYLPEDLRYFKEVTMGKPIIMGRKTFESIGKPLPGRLNIVITRDSNWSAEGVKIVASLEEAVEVGEAQAMIDGVEETVIIGGAQIYAQSLPLVDRLYLTQVEAEPEGDAHFPEIDYGQWQELGRQSFPAGDQPNRYPYAFIVYDRSEA